ncbi:MAG: MarR family winged helix-turn-helix transcriptional regulator [Planctomycetota bacterium]|nr:MarR family winged helix-turn-helix transcriptional regulator [Planctomycetota bacterium]
MSDSLPSPERVFRSLPCLCAATLTASRALSRAYSCAIQDSGLEITQFAILQLLQSLGPMTQTELGDRLAAGKTTVSRNIALMERDGLVTSEPGPDKRTRLVDATSLGRRRLRAAEPGWNAVQTRVQQDMPKGTFEALLKALPDATLAALRT